MHYNISVDGYKGFRYLNNIETARAKATERLSSGYRVNHTSDDAAAASLSNTLRTQIRGLMQASRNSEDMINLLNTAETGIATMTEMLQRIRELSVRAASDTNTTEDRMYMQEEVSHLLEEIERVSKDTEFNGITLFKAEAFGEPAVVKKEITRPPVIHAQVGSNTDERLSIEFPYISLQALDLEDIDITTRENATDALGRMDESLAYLTKERAKISLWASRISYSASNADIGAYNNTLSDSKVMDTNYGDEMLQLSKAQVLTEFGVSSISEVQKLIENVLKFIS